jgi:hypothetical protein
MPQDASQLPTAQTGERSTRSKSAWIASKVATWVLILAVLLAITGAVLVGFVIKWTRDALPPVDRL